MKEVSKDAKAEGNEGRVPLSTLSIWATAKPQKHGRRKMQIENNTLGIVHGLQAVHLRWEHASILEEWERTIFMT